VAYPLPNGLDDGVVVHKPQATVKLKQKLKIRLIKININWNMFQIEVDN
jgi:hypothetical protein